MLPSAASDLTAASVGQSRVTSARPSGWQVTVQLRIPRDEPPDRPSAVTETGEHR
jgi:hypothetical protein